MGRDRSPKDPGRPFLLDEVGQMFDRRRRKIGILQPALGATAQNDQAQIRRTVATDQTQIRR